MKILVKLTLLTLFFSMSSCTGLSGKAYYLAKREAAKARPAYEQFQELCESRSRVFINNSIEVDGYLYAATSGSRCKGGWDVLVEQGYKYYECSKEEVLDHNLEKLEDIYRLEIRDGNDRACVSWDYVAKELISSNKAKKYRKKLSGKCFVRSKVDKPKSAYAMLLENGYVNGKGNHILKFPNDDKKKNLIRFDGVYIINLKTQKALSVNRNYQYWPEGISNKAVGKYTCDDDENVNQLNVLIPK